MNHRNQKGLAAVTLMAIIVILVFIGGYLVIRTKLPDSNKSDLNNQSETQSGCSFNDYDLCKHLQVQKNIKDYSHKSIKYALLENGQKGEIVDESLEYYSGEKSHIISVTGKDSILENKLEEIRIGEDLYQKNFENNTWTHLTPSTREAEKMIEIEENSEISKTGESVEEGTPEGDSSQSITAPVEPQYKKLDKEKCGQLMCFKYEMTNFEDIESGYPATTIWFDDAEYLLRKMEYLSTHGAPSDGIYENTYDYDNINIEKPSGAIIEAK